MIDESVGESDSALSMDLRSAVIGSWEAGLWFSMWQRKSAVRRLQELGYIIRQFALVNNPSIPWSRKRRKQMDVDKMVDRWIEAVVGLSTAHDKDEYDAHDAKSDELMTPLLAAPIKQVREFYHRLLEKMKADKRVPMIVWMGFEAWGEVLVKDAPDAGVKRLKTRLANEIADLVEEDVRDQIPKAIARALRWRSEETLQEVKETLVKGAKPKLVGRQSCLFLEVGRGSKKKQVML